MTVLSTIMGILLIIGGFSCMFTPLATVLQTGIFIGIMMLVYGITGIIRGFKNRATALEVIISVLALIVGLISIFRPGSTLVFDAIMLNMFAVWYIVQGVISIVAAIQVRKLFSGWILGLISGILGVVLGLYSFAHPMVTAVTVGILIGLYFVESGFNLIAIAPVFDHVRR